jgi:hypothetical protein
MLMSFQWQQKYKNNFYFFLYGKNTYKFEKKRKKERELKTKNLKPKIKNKKLKKGVQETLIATPCHCLATLKFDKSPRI